MNEVHRWIEEIVALPAVTPKRVGEIVGVKFALDEERPTAVFYKGDGDGRLRLARLRISKSHSGWGVHLYFRFKEEPYFEKELDLARYGAATSMQMFPDMRPEGCFGPGFTYGEHNLVFVLTSDTKRLVELVVAK